MELRGVDLRGFRCGTEGSGTEGSGTEGFLGWNSRSGTDVLN